MEHTYPRLVTPRSTLTPPVIDATTVDGNDDDADSPHDDGNDSLR